MAALNLCYYGNPLLKKKSRDVTDVTPLKQFIDDMFETLYTEGGVGLAAVQVGNPLNLFIVNVSWKDGTEEEERSPGVEEVFINPKILSLHGDDVEVDEGCLSIPDVRELLTRKSHVDIEYTDRHGKRKTEKSVSGLKARAIQHEMDHLNGILFVDKLPPTKRLFLKRELKKIAKEFS
ncbi:MAG: peptide deformylase [Candidatus Raymondbacteria bacterium RifOxyA12_full_50_37]|uniref:Peptide deformylase n=1 Tax=Candidatus Raymondbacteria bacterium RIFOXYD12_FULL_49_13 TaxID=1817890 RepID=A0A1F7FBH3_UNCRA|nr:MAG: peptide deformylase [Candidatus Raymondbacteria bacterium RifOxyA12_full_50_37]OGJ87714.1 MAG: peptide deformylase [Candidatus Raymondbacteria bacterium RifOxyB12_full_50_8]OGJ92531.1 MAG: peptide deformylase [Candidatus Raymondbacteria bacterium RIFOXYA2_FULL_49_16]OGJ97726.1 MAG: peptide deformylase [Candidatus Raymondbacteria bacterium RifOxyC12_full_50_8]OGJ97885.1 MAG: peptide deformylase [Candidatus Raymondbacteria bacterium RIFOXYC2_FULL_50_21]OGK03836.1 MAG: peptide deformylase